MDLKSIGQSLSEVISQFDSLYWRENNLEKQRLIDEAVSKLHEAQSLLVKYSR